MSIAAGILKKTRKPFVSAQVNVDYTGISHNLYGLVGGGGGGGGADLSVVDTLC